MYRTVLAVLIAVAVAVAPVGFGLASAHTMSKTTMGMLAMDMASVEDCHGKMVSSSDHSDKTGQDHSCCGDAKANCTDVCGITCCKLMGMAAELHDVGPPAFGLPEPVDPQKPPEWRLRPRPPPPRA
jgi:hypothetical protein